MTHLLDGNVLVALVVEDHVHHRVARAWFGGGRAFATCPITQGTLLRLLVRDGMSAVEGARVLARVTEHSGHELWGDCLDYADVNLSAVVGHRQVTDAYLAQLARSRSGRLATLDRGVAGVHPDVTELLEPAD